MFCSSHNAVGCDDCMFLDHNTCQVEQIQDISTAYFDGHEHSELQSRLDKLHEELEQLKEGIRSGEKKLEQVNSEAIGDINAFRKEINDYLDRMEREIMSEVKKSRQTDERLMSTLKNDEHTLRQEIAELQGKLRLHANQANELFVSAKRIQGKIVHLDTRIKEMLESTHIMQYAFQQSKKMKEILASRVPLGELKEKKDIAEMAPEFDSEINLKTAEDKTDCSIWASALLSPNQIVLADYNNQCLKLVDVDLKKLTVRYKLIKEPNDITVMGPNLIVVLLAQEKIQFLTVTRSNQLTESHDINAPGCYKIASQNDLVLAAYVDRVTIMNARGIEQETAAISCLNHPMTVEFGTEEDTFFVADCLTFVKGFVYKFDLAGGLICKYEDKNLSDVRGLTVTRDGTLLVCNWDENGSIHVITPDCMKIKEILRDNKHVNYPIAVSFCNTTNRLFICNYETCIDSPLKNVLKIFLMN